MKEQRYTLLVSEDDTIHRKMIEHAFKRLSADYSLHFADNLQETKRKLNENRFDCIISDIYLPDGMGSDLLKEDNLPAKTPVIIMTGQGSETIAASVMKAGAADYIVKSEDNFRNLPGIVERTIREWKLKESKKQAEQELNETKERLNTILNTMAEGMVMVNTEGQIVFANPAARKIVGLRHDSIVGKYYFERDWQQIDADGNPFPEEKLPLAVALSRKEEALDVVHGIKDRAGNIKWLSVNANPLFDTSGNLYGAIASFRDITKRRKAEKELEKSVNFYLTLFDQLPNPKLRTNASGDCNYVNNAWTDITGRAKEREFGDLWMDRIQPDERDEIAEKLRKAFSAKKELKTECRILNKNGEYRWYTLIGRPFNNLENIFAGYIITLNDITEQKNEENYLRTEMDRELNILDSLSSNPKTSITARSLGIRSVKEGLPILFDRFVQQFSELLDKSFEQRIHKTTHDYSSSLKKMGQELGHVNAGPRDIIEIYTTALRNKSKSIPVMKAQAYAEDGRMMALELVGNLANFYRNFYIRSVVKE